ncbi:MAG: HEAT repeat domain-containing protein [Myxococcales bacterium]|nr:HEAT repeat domain-containing protein [Myxococcales bacterium]
MGLVLALLVATLVGALWALATRGARARRERRHEEAFERVVEDLGLVRSNPRAAHGQAGPHRLEIEHHPAWGGDRDDVRTRIRLWGHDLPDGLSLRAMHLLALEERVPTGDAAFDTSVHLSGLSPPEVSARFDCRTRELVQRAIGLGATYTRRTWLLDLPGTLGPDHELVPIVRLLARCADYLGERRDLPRALLARAVRDPLPSVRTVAAHRLISSTTAGDLERDEAVLDRLGSHPDPMVRLAVAQLGGPRGIRLRRELLRHERADVRAGAAVELAALTLPGADPELERALIELLDQGGADVVRALGRVGTAPSVLPLQGVQAAALPLTELSRASTEALRAIRARLVGERGTLSVPELLGGELADATNPLRAGRVALAPAEGGGARSHRAEQRDARPRFATPSSR